MVRIPTTIIGSMPKPKWLAADWYSIMGDWLLSGAALAEAQDDATRLAVADQERAGIDIVCDGEQRRPSHHSYFLSHVARVDFENMKKKVRRGGGSPQDVPCVVGPVALRAHHTLEAILEVITGRIDWIYTTAASVVSMLKDGKLKGLIVSSKARLE